MKQSIITTTFIIAIAASVMMMGVTQGQSVDAKFCNPHGCKGSFHWYTMKGHHHCYAHSHNCKHFIYGPGDRGSGHERGGEHY